MPKCVRRPQRHWCLMIHSSCRIWGPGPAFVYKCNTSWRGMQSLQTAVSSLPPLFSQWKCCEWDISRLVRLRRIALSIWVGLVVTAGCRHHFNFQTTIIIKSAEIQLNDDVSNFWNVSCNLALITIFTSNLFFYFSGKQNKPVFTR